MRAEGGNPQLTSLKYFEFFKRKFKFKFKGFVLNLDY